MADSAVGTTRLLRFDTFNDSGEPADAARTLLYVTEPTGHTVTVNPVAPVDVGRYEWPLVINRGGWWQWSWVAQGGTQAQARPRTHSGGFLAGDTGSEPLHPWCTIADVLVTPQVRKHEEKGVVDREVLERAILAATEHLHQATWRRFRGIGVVELRPCCQCQTLTLGELSSLRVWLLGGWYRGDREPTIAGVAECGCSHVEEVVLPADVRAIDDVLINGASFSAWRLDRGGRLVRTDGQAWPCCQNLHEASTEDDTFAVSAVVGESETNLARLACTELAAEFFLGIADPAACRIPTTVTTVNRQGSTYQKVQSASVNGDGTLGLRLTDIFVRDYGRRKKRGMRIASPDVAPETRAVG